MRYRLPVGEDDFAKVRQEYYFVDKSPFIREFMDKWCGDAVHAAAALWQDADAIDAEVFL